MAIATESITWSHGLEYLVFVTVYWFFALLPLRVAVRLGAAIGSLLYVCARPQRRIGLRNLEMAFPEKTEGERREILQRSCRNLGRVGAEFCHLTRLTPERLQRYVHVDDPERWQQLCRPGHGGIVLTAHLGNWELLAYTQGLLGRPVTLVHHPLRNPLIDQIINAVRSRAGTRYIFKQTAAREAIRVLRDGGIMAIPSDQNQKARDGVFVDLFGVPACTSPGAARLAMRTKCLIVPAFLVRQGETERHRLLMLPAVELEDSGDRDADILTNTQRCNAVIEQMLRQYPDQWIWFHRRWRTRPAGERPIY